MELGSKRGRDRVARLYYLAGVGCLVAAFLFAILGAYGAAAGLADAPLAGSICALAFLVPGVAFTLFWMRAAAVGKRLRALSDILRGYGEITIADLAKRIGTSPEDAELLVAACLGRGLVSGRLVAGEGRFVLAKEEPPVETDPGG